MTNDKDNFPEEMSEPKAENQGNKNENYTREMMFCRIIPQVPYKRFFYP